jgi:Uri superfamily endonuclease
VYTGSGKRNLAARLARHLRQDKTHRWHVDYLRAAARIRQVWIWRWTDDAECRTNAWMQTQAGATIPWMGFGSSDCRCGSHLTAFRVRPHPRWGGGVPEPLLALDIEDG